MDELATFILGLASWVQGLIDTLDPSDRPIAWIGLAVAVLFVIGRITFQIRFKYVEVMRRAGFRHY